MGGTSAAAVARWLSSVRPSRPLVTATAPTPTAAPRKRRRSKSIIRGASRCRGVARRSSQPSDQALTAMATAAGGDRQDRVEQRIEHGGQQGEQAQRPDTANRPATSERRASSPMAADRTSAPITTATLSAALSLVPNRSTTNCFAPGGCSEISSAPIDSTGDGAPGTRPAISSVTPRPRAPASTPHSAAGGATGRGSVGRVLAVGASSRNADSSADDTEKATWRTLRP